MKRILFVDDEPKVLDGLRRMLRGLRHEWEMDFVEGGAAALERLAAAPADVVVTDMRMPGMCGSDLLHEVAKRHPSMVRIILSGQCDRETVLRSVGVAHQFLTKPCDSETIKSTVARACLLRDRIANESHRRLASRVEALGSLPAAFAAFTAEARQRQPSVERIGRIVAADLGMTVKVLQLVNSGFFGSPQRVVDPSVAVQMLGAETMRALVDAGYILALPREDTEVGRVLEQLAHHSRETARLAREIAWVETSDLHVAEGAHLAGYLHDLGLAVLVQEGLDRLVSTRSSTDGDGDELWKRLRCYDSFAHADIGAYLAGLWGLPETILDPIAFHHRPALSADTRFSILTAVHAADAITTGAMDSLLAEQSSFDLDYLGRVGCLDRIGAWLDISRTMLLEEVAQ